MSKYTQLTELIIELFDAFEIEYDSEGRKLEDAKIILSNIKPDSISKIRDIVLEQGLLDVATCEKTKFFRHVIERFQTGDETCMRMVRILAEKFLPSLAAVCPVSDKFLHTPYEYIVDLSEENYPKIGLCFDKLDYVLNN